jgi:hypothetical protein
VDENGVKFGDRGTRLLIKCGIPTKREAKSVTQIRDKIPGPAFQKMNGKFRSDPTWDQRSLKCPDLGAWVLELTCVRASSSDSGKRVASAMFPDALGRERGVPATVEVIGSPMSL